LPDALIDILHNSQGLLFHPRAVTPLGSSPRTAYRRVRALRVLSLMCMCSCFHMGDQIHCTHEASRKSVYHPSLATRGQFGSGIRSHHDHHSEEFSLVATACNHSSECYSILCRPTSGHLLRLIVILISVSTHRTLRSCLLVCMAGYRITPVLVFWT
jgi:hypothetical protein